MTWISGPLAGFDLETTGVDPTSAKIVTACVGLAREPGQWVPANWLLKCGEIPEGASAIHGISTEYANEHGMDAATGTAAIRDSLYEAWATGAPVIGHNIAYDFTLLDHNLAALGMGGLDIAGPVLDTMVLDRELDKYRKGRRTLTAACEHYGIALSEEDAHTAEADTFAAVRLLWKIAHTYNLGEKDLDDLTASQTDWHAARQADFAAYLRREGKDASDVSGDWPIRRAA